MWWIASFACMKCYDFFCGTDMMRRGDADNFFCNFECSRWDVWCWTRIWITSSARMRCLLSLQEWCPLESLTATIRCCSAAFLHTVILNAIVSARTTCFFPPMPPRTPITTIIMKALWIFFIVMKRCVPIVTRNCICCLSPMSSVSGGCDSDMSVSSDRWTTGHRALTHFVCRNVSPSPRLTSVASERR